MPPRQLSSMAAMPSADEVYLLGARRDKPAVGLDVDLAALIIGHRLPACDQPDAGGQSQQ
jgi:hypothetical protein